MIFRLGRLKSGGASGPGMSFATCAVSCGGCGLLGVVDSIVTWGVQCGFDVQCVGVVCVCVW